MLGELAYVLHVAHAVFAIDHEDRSPQKTQFLDRDAKRLSKRQILVIRQKGRVIDAPLSAPPLLGEREVRAHHEDAYVFERLRFLAQPEDLRITHRRVERGHRCHQPHLTSAVVEGIRLEGGSEDVEVGAAFADLDLPANQRERLRAWLRVALAWCLLFSMSPLRLASAHAPAGLDLRWISLIETVRKHGSGGIRGFPELVHPIAPISPSKVKRR